MGYRSPKGNELQRLEGNAGDIYGRGEDFITLGSAMRDTARVLKDIHEGGMKSRGTDALKEACGQTYGDLEKAAVRYSDSGPVLKTYAAALDTAQTWIHPRISDIEEAVDAVAGATLARNMAQSSVDSLAMQPTPEGTPPPDTSTADSDLATARQGLDEAIDARDDLWTRFDTEFEAWSDAYDTAVDRLGDAIENADNNDNFWDDIGDFVDILGWVIVGLAVVALFVAGGPLFWVLVGLSALHLALQIGRYQNGNVSFSDVVWSAVGLLSFGAAGAIAKVASRGAPAIAGVVRTGRSVTVTSVRSALPTVRWFTPWRFATNPIRVGVAGLRTGRAPIFTNPITAMRTGDAGAAQSLAYLNRLSGYARKYPDVNTFVNATRAAVTPSQAVQTVQTTIYVGGQGVGITSGAGVGVLPSFDAPSVGGR